MLNDLHPIDPRARAKSVAGTLARSQLKGLATLALEAIAAQGQDLTTVELSQGARRYISMNHLTQLLGVE